MKKIIGTLGALAASAGMAQAGAVDRGSQSTAFIFETGSYVELTFGYLSPDVEGTEVTIPGSANFNGSNSGNMYSDYPTGSLSIKTDYGDNLSVGFIIDKPFGADTDYPVGTGYIAQGTTANLDSTAYTALVKYKFASNVSVLGGLRYQTLSADANIPFLGQYKVVGESDGGFGYVLGVAWEKPEIAARVSLTYNSKIDYSLPTTETNPLGSVSSVSETSTPQSVNLEFQTGIAPNTLLFGGVRWVEWSDFVINPPVYANIAKSPLVFYNDDVLTYTLGLGYKFNDTWSGAITYIHDDAIGGYSLNLGPVDGYDSIGLAASYTRGDMKITAAVRYYDLGDTQTRIGALAPATNFDGNSAVGFGLRVGYRF